MNNSLEAQESNTSHDANILVIKYVRINSDTSRLRQPIILRYIQIKVHLFYLCIS